MPYYVSEIPAGTFELDYNEEIISTSPQFLNDLFTPQGEITHVKLIDFGGDGAPDPGDKLEIQHSGGSISGTYVGPMTISTAGGSSSLIGVADVSVMVNPISGHVFRTDDDTLHFISDRPTDDNLLATQVSVRVAGLDLVSLELPVNGDTAGLRAALQQARNDLYQTTYDSTPGGPIAQALAAAAAVAPVDLALTTLLVGDVLGGLLTTATNQVVMNFTPGGTVAFPPINEVLCFARGTLIRTPDGWTPVEALRVGDLVLTRDGGPQPIRWRGMSAVTAERLALVPRLRPVRIRAGALGAGIPAQDLVVSPQHRMLLRSRIALRMFAAAEVFVPARQLLDLPGVEVVNDGAGVEYHHLLLDRHQVIIANGAETETLYPGAMALGSLDHAACEEIYSLFPDLRARDHVLHRSRPFLSGQQSRNLVGRHRKHQRVLVAQEADLA